ncbi:MAG TPA: twin-arginine translocation signal domain-containing protein, partial [Roseiflexaceae bacterium]|nr:twin-arginine translocation signal domain-containing protein [Roseiflexaceae bacterium]
MASKFSRRQFLRFTGAAGSAALLAACGGSSATTPTTAPEAAPTAAPDAPAPTTAAQASASSGKLSVLWENWGDIYNNLMTVIGEDFTKANPGLALEWNFDPDWVTKLTTLVAANTLPDITIMRSGPLANVGGKGV